MEDVSVEGHLPRHRAWLSSGERMRPLTQWTEGTASMEIRTVYICNNQLSGEYKVEKKWPSQRQKATSHSQIIPVFHSCPLGILYRHFDQVQIQHANEILSGKRCTLEVYITL